MCGYDAIKHEIKQECQCIERKRSIKPNHHPSPCPAQRSDFRQTVGPVLDRNQHLPGLHDSNPVVHAPSLLFPAELPPGFGTAPIQGHSQVERRLHHQLRTSYVSALQCANKKELKGACAKEGILFASFWAGFIQRYLKEFLASQR